MYAKDTLVLMEGLRARLSNPVYHQYLTGFLDSTGMQFAPAERDDRRSAGERFSLTMRTTLERSTPFLLTDEMLPVVSFAARGLEDEMQVTRDLWPTDFGFLVIDKGMTTAEKQGRQIVTKAVAWWRHTARVQENGRALSGTVVVSLADLDDPRDEVTQELLARGASYATLSAMGRLQVNHVIFVPDGVTIGPVDYASDKKDAHGQPLGVQNLTRFMASFFLMLRQTITSTKVEAAAPRLAKTLAKRRLPTDVTVVQMRRIEGVNRGEGESRIEWANRWLVTGHWRNQPVGEHYPGAVEVEPGRYVARIWIAPFVKGPEGAPLKPTSRKIIALTR